MEHIEKSVHGGDVYRNQVDLDFSVNINPFGMPDGVKQALKKAVEDCVRYPDEMVEDLKIAMANKLGISQDCLAFGNGASELFVAIIHAIKPKTVLIPVPSFSGYQKAAECEDCAIRYYYMKKENQFLLTDAFCQQLKQQIKMNQAPDMIFLANPNNPTGACISSELLEQIVELCGENKITLVMDECFLEFTDKLEESLIQKAACIPNLIVVRAFTKIYGIPGVRLGYLAASKELVVRIKRQLPEWNVSMFAQYAGVAALKETAFVQKTVEYIRTQRTYLMTNLQKLGFAVWPAEANYLLLYSDQNLYEHLLHKKILIRDCSNYEGLENGYYRIAVKKKEENERLISILTSIGKQ